MKSIIATACLALAALAGPGAITEAAEPYPSRVVTIVVPFAAGSGSDTAARIIGQYLSPRLGQNVVVENKVGATGAVASTAVARAEPDGHTLLLGTNSTHGSNVALYRKLNYDPVKDFAPVAHTGLFNYFLVVNPEVPATSLAELVTYAKAHPGRLSYAGGSSTSIVIAETFAKSTGIEIQKIPYRSNPPALTDVVAGRVSMMFVDISSAIAFVQGGQLRALGVTTKGRSAIVPDLPTIDETVAKGFDLVSWTGLFAPAGTPAPVVERLSTEVNAILALPEVKEKFARLGVEGVPSSPSTFAQYVTGEVDTWSRLVREAGIQVE